MMWMFLSGLLPFESGAESVPGKLLKGGGGGISVKSRGSISSMANSKFIHPGGYSRSSSASVSDNFSNFSGHKTTVHIGPVPKKSNVAKTVSGSKSPVVTSVRPVISAQKQAGHILGTPQNANRRKQSKPTSSFFGKKSGDYLTQQAFRKGKPVLGRPNVREHDFGVSTGTGQNGGMQSRVRVHQDSKGRIHGHPFGRERL